MSLLLNILIALGLAFGICFLLVAGTLATVCVVLTLNKIRLRDIGLKDIPASFPAIGWWIIGFFFFIALTALYLPPIGRACIVAGVFFTMLGYWIALGIFVHARINQRR